MSASPIRIARGQSSAAAALTVTLSIWLTACAPSPSPMTSVGGGGSPGGSSSGGTGPGGGAGGSAAAGGGGGHTRLTVEEDLPAWAPPDVLARRLARLVWNTDADSSVTDALVGTVTRDSVGRLASQMLADVRARDGVTAFYRWWLFFENVDTVGDPRPVDTALRSEAPALGVYLTLDTAGTFTDLLTAPYTFVNETLAAAYGMSGVSGPELRRVPYPAGEPRIGMLTGAGLLSFFSSLVNPSWPAKRSWMVTDPLLCTTLIRSFLPSFVLDINRSIRQQMIEATASPSCDGCHKILNSPGFAFIGFDSFGRWHPEPGAAANETQGWIPADIMPDAPRFDGPAQLANLLANRDETRRCFTRQWIQFATDRNGLVNREGAAADEASAETAMKAFAQSNFQLRALIVAVTRTNTFLRP